MYYYILVTLLSIYVEKYSIINYISNTSLEGPTRPVTSYTYINYIGKVSTKVGG